MTRIATPIVLVAALFGAPVPSHAQAASACPEIEAGEAGPIELRIGDFVLRAQVTSESADGDGARVEGRLISCERERVIGDPDPDAADSADLAGIVTVLRLLHDFRVSFDMAPAQEGGCIRAGVDVEDGAGQRPTPGADRPLTVEICGLPQR